MTLDKKFCFKTYPNVQLVLLEAKTYLTFLEISHLSFRLKSVVNMFCWQSKNYYDMINCCLHQKTFIFATNKLKCFSSIEHLMMNLRNVALQHQPPVFC